jgi:hypothetical protein
MSEIRAQRERWLPEVHSREAFPMDHGGYSNCHTIHFSACGQQVERQSVHRGSSTTKESGLPRALPQGSFGRKTPWVTGRRRTTSGKLPPSLATYDLSTESGHPQGDITIGSGTTDGRGRAATLDLEDCYVIQNNTCHVMNDRARAGHRPVWTQHLRRSSVA